MREVEDSKKPDMDSKNMAEVTKTVYQLVAVGKLDLNQQQVMIYSSTVYRTNEAAEAAIPEYKASLLKPRPNNQLMKLAPDPLRVFVKLLEVE